MATIYEVSKLAGVSLATVSRVINNSGKVTVKTRQKVLTAIEELGYRPNSMAQCLASERSNSVGILIPELHGPFFGIMLSSIERELREAGKRVIITAGHSDETKERDCIEFLLDSSCDALILHIYSVSKNYIKDLTRGSVPIVLLNGYMQEIADRCISLDNEHGGYAATKCLLERGHTEIVYVSGPHWKVDSFKRLSGHKRALADYGIAVDERLIFEGDFEEASGREAMNHFLKLGVSFTGVICANDEMAAGAMQGARAHGLSIPGDLSVVGYDDVAFTRYLNPQLSSVNCRIEEMGQMAARAVLKHAYDTKDLVIQNTFKPHVMLRASIGSR